MVVIMVKVGVKEMIKRKVRKDFDKNQPITVDVSNSSVEEKKKVQQAFFDIGVRWEGKEGFNHLSANAYSNVRDSGEVRDYIMYDFQIFGGEITPKDFFKMVYEDFINEVEGYTKVDDLNSFKWIINRADKELYYAFIERDVPVESYHKYKLGDICHNCHGEVVSTDSYGISKVVGEGVEKVFFIYGDFYTKNNVIDFNYEEYCKGGYVVKTRGGLEVTQVKKFNIASDYTLGGVVDNHTIETWTGDGKYIGFNREIPNDLVMYKV